jgi:uncharacterized protein
MGPEVETTFVPIAGEGITSATSNIVVFAHGAGGSMNDPLLVDLSSRLIARGLGVVRFPFLYRALGKKLPDRMPVLESTYRDVLSKLRETHPRARLIIGGKSMGGRVASHLVAAGEEVAGLCLLSYPLQPQRPSKTDRTTHLKAITKPVFLAQGTRDPFGGPNEVARYLNMKRTKVVTVEGGDHDLNVLRSANKSRDAVLEEVAAELATWSHAIT